MAGRRFIGWKPFARRQKKPALVAGLDPRINVFDDTKITAFIVFPNFQGDK